MTELESSENNVISVYEDYRSNLLWFFRNGSLENSSGEDLGLSPDLVRSIIQLSDENDARYDRHEPQIVRPMHEDYRERVWSIARRVALELGSGWKVMALDVRSGELINVDL